MVGLVKVKPKVGDGRGDGACRAVVGSEVGFVCLPVAVSELEHSAVPAAAPGVVAAVAVGIETADAAAAVAVAVSVAVALRPVRRMLVVSRLA